MLRSAASKVMWVGRARLFAILLAVMVALVLGCATRAYAAPEDLDTSFDGDGKLTTSFGATGAAQDVAVQTDGKIIVAGYASNGINNDFALARYKPDGTLDTTFGDGGKVITPIGSGDDEAASLAIQADGNIVVAGYTFNGTNKDFALARYTPDGSLDPNFHGEGPNFYGNGKVITRVSPLNTTNGHDEARAVAIQPDGKIVVAGYYYSLSDNDFALARYNPGGSLDETFFSGSVGPGIVTTRFSDADESAQSLAIQEDGKIVAAGYGTDSAIQKFALARYNVDGVPDTSFNTTGKLMVSFTGATAEGQDVAIQGDGKVVVAGYSLVEDAGNYTFDFALTRRNADGSPDTSFGQDLDVSGTPDGKVLTSLGSGHDHAKALALQPNGKIVLAGHSLNGTGGDFALTRYEADGSLDETFDGDGKLTTTVSSGDDQAQGLALQLDGKIVVAGRSFNGSNYDFALARYEGDDLTPPNATITSGPSGITRDTSASFSFTSTEVGSTFQCSLDGGTFSACTSPKSYDSLSQGKHTFQVRAKDAAGNVDASPASRTWKVDTIKPTISGMSPRHKSIIRDTTPTIKATVKDNLTNLQERNIKLFVAGKAIPASKFRYSATTDKLTYTSPKLGKGKKTIKIVATDAAGNVGAKSWYFRIR